MSAPLNAGRVARPGEPAGSAASPTRRMTMAVLALAGVLIAAYMLLYKLGVITTLVCGGAHSCESVQSSPWSSFLGLPVPLWGVAGYGLILVTALLGIQPALMQDRRVAWILLLCCTVAFLFSAYLSWIEQTRIAAWCRWCIGSAVVATLLFLLSLPEIGLLRRGMDG